MLKQESVLKVTDNTGVKTVQIIRKLGKNSKKVCIGDVVVVHVTNAVPTSTIKKGAVCKAVVVRTRYSFTRANGVLILFSENSAVLVGDDKAPSGTRVFGPILRELKFLGFQKLISISSEII